MRPEPRKHFHWSLSPSNKLVWPPTVDFTPQWPATALAMSALAAAPATAFSSGFRRRNSSAGSAKASTADPMRSVGERFPVSDFMSISWSRAVTYTFRLATAVPEEKVRPICALPLSYDTVKGQPSDEIQSGAMRLLIVEDDAPIAASLQRTLARSGNAVDVSINGRTALHAIGEADYDCVILDLGLPDIDGTEVLRQVRRHNQKTPIVILSAREDAADRVLGLDLGADDYVAKPFNLSELEARIRAVTRRAIARRGNDISVGELRLSLGRRMAFVSERAINFLPREFAVLECLLLRQGRVVSKRHLLEQITGWDTDLSEAAVELYVHRVRRKIEGSGCAIRTLRGFGYLLQLDGIDSH